MSWECRRFLRRLWLPVLLVVVSVSALPAQRIQYEAVGTRAMVTSAHSLATQAGVDILRKGGNAFDAAVAVAATLNVMDLDKVPPWRGDYVAIRQLVDDYARYVYLPRLKGPEVLTNAIQEGCGLLLWRNDSFGCAGVGWRPPSAE